ncbi:Zn-ribbon domain-containing OB-fold protein [Rhabdothermincola salaria]|uniref:Zn-ribbon domain-containing OB-fold protein n=1 Tax=Rhabdothermincola salaria TaxID=2903142 RepID=UPI001E2C83B5|nr:OB-fold domain-containing protein [Rhabdothermincola salaria]MCD9623820.1 OB-fold domain-containing protein [Rhabdothermincola salaria]
MADVVRESVFRLQFPFQRTLGPTVGAFASALADQTLIGVKVGDRVITPPLEYDPENGAAAGTDFVKVGPKGTVTGWTWVPEPTHLHPLQKPFAFAFVTLDGADTPMFHAVDVDSADAMSIGMRVEPRWRSERQGRIDDLEAFVPASDGGPSEGAGDPWSAPEELPVDAMEMFCDLTYVDNTAPATIIWMKSLLEGKLIGQKCPQCERIYVGPRGMCCVDAIELDESHLVDVPDKGVITNFTVITPTPYPGQTETEPFARCSILLDGTDAVLNQQAMLDVDAYDIRVGMHVECVWAPPEERNVDDVGNRGWGVAGDCMRGWRPTGEPDEPEENYVERMM